MVVKDSGWWGEGPRVRPQNGGTREISVVKRWCCPGSNGTDTKLHGMDRSEVLIFWF